MREMPVKKAGAILGETDHRLWRALFAQVGAAAVARRRLAAWGGWVQREVEARASGLLEPMRQAAAVMERHLEGILEHWQQGLTTAFLEGLNRLFSAVERKARGHRSTEHQTAMLYFVAGKLQIPYHGG